MKIYFDSFSETNAAFSIVADALKGASNLERISRSHGAEEIIFRDGDTLATIQFRTHTAKTKKKSERCGCSCSI